MPSRRRNGIRSFDTFEELCASVDVVDLCTPPSSHEELAIQALNQGKHVIIEKPLTGYFGAGIQDFQGNRYSKETMLREAVSSCARILAAAKASGNRVCYAENWIYAPAVQKEREILAKSKGPGSMDVGRAVSQRVSVPLLRLAGGSPEVGR